MADRKMRKRIQQVYEDFNVSSDKELEEVLRDDLSTIPCMGCNKPIFIDKQKIVWISGDPYHTGCA